MPDPAMIKACANIATQKLAPADRFAVHSIAEIAARHGFLQGWYEGHQAAIQRAAAPNDRLRGAAQALSDFAWSAVTADCDEARDHLNTLVANLRAALSTPSPRNAVEADHDH